MACSEYLTKCSKRSELNFQSGRRFLGRQGGNHTKRCRSNWLQFVQWNLIFNFVTCSVFTSISPPGREHVWCTLLKISWCSRSKSSPRICFFPVDITRPPLQKTNPARHHAFGPNTEPIRTTALPAHLKAPNHCLQTLTARGKE